MSQIIPVWSHLAKANEEQLLWSVLCETRQQLLLYLLLLHKIFVSLWEMEVVE